MEFATISGIPLKVSRVGLGTWAIGGWMAAPTRRSRLRQSAPPLHRQAVVGSASAR
jgi:aryl-alcohol dehydrogenase-like predicted oxidoreductase